MTVDNKTCGLKSLPCIWQTKIWLVTVLRTTMREQRNSMVALLCWVLLLVSSLMLQLDTLSLGLFDQSKCSLWRHGETKHPLWGTLLGSWWWTSIHSWQRQNHYLQQHTGEIQWTTTQNFLMAAWQCWESWQHLAHMHLQDKSSLESGDLYVTVLHPHCSVHHFNHA